MTKADTIFKENITKIMEEGVWSEQARPKYKDGTTANSKYITGSFAEYDLSKGEFPITTLRPIAIKSAIKEVFWIYQDQTNSLDVLEDKYNVHYWNDWEVEGVPANNGDKRSIGQRYGAVVKKHDIINRLLAQLEANPWNRRNVIPFGITRPSRRQLDFSLAPSRPWLMFVVGVRTFIWMPL